jgi:hypothetical protein
VIKATGSLEDEADARRSDDQSLTPVNPAPGNVDTGAGSTAELTSEGDTTTTATTPLPTRAERLASDIFQFMTAASSLSSSLHSTLTTKKPGYANGTGYRQPQDNKSKENTDQSVNPEEVQLLRVRTKKHEIIIFPDSNFLCCVVQNMERTGR